MFPKIVVTAAALIGACQALPSANQLTNDIDSLTNLLATANDKAAELSAVSIFTSAQTAITSYQQAVVAENNLVSGIATTKVRRQECLDLSDVQSCLDDVEEIVESPGQLLPSSNVERRQAVTSYTDTEQQQICTAFSTSVTTHDQLLRTLIGKHGVVSLTPFTAPIGALIRSDESVADTFGFQLLDNVPTCQQEVQDRMNSLDQIFTTAQNTYN